MNFQFQNITIQFDYNSPVILTYLFWSLGAWFFNSITKGKTNRLLFSCYRSSFLNPFTYIRLFTHAIGHKDLEHLIHNFLFILLVGPMIEEKYGSINLIIMFLITSFVIAVFHLIFDDYSILGASGNVYMLIVLSSFSNITEGKIPLTLILILIFYVIGEIRKSLLERNQKIYHDGHLLGALCGILFGFYFLSFSAFPFLS